MKYAYSKLLTLMLVVLLSSCTSLFGDDEPEPTLLTVNITTSSKINPSKLSEGNPVVISFYQLTKVDAFKSAQALDLYQQDSKILAGTLIQKNTLLSLLPSKKSSINLTILPGTKYLAVFAQFSNYSQAKSTSWLDISKIDDIKNIEVSLDSLTINMFLAPKGSFWSW